MAADIQHFPIIGICDISVRLPITEIHLKCATLALIQNRLTQFLAKTIYTTKIKNKKKNMPLK